MKAVFTLAGLMTTALSLAQVFIEHNIPTKLATGTEKEVDVVIHRPAYKGFSQYEITFQAGLAITARQSAGGTFRGEDNKVRVMWSITPAGQLRMRFALMPAATGSYILRQRFEFEQEGQRRVVYLEDLRIDVSETVVSQGSTPFSRLNQVVPKDVPFTHIDSLEADMKDPAKAGFHVAQLRRDADEARKVGKNELKEAELEITEARKALDQASRNSDEKVKAGLVKEAEERLVHAENNKQIALKILALADSLEKNADEIERAGAGARGDSSEKVAESKSSSEIAELKKMFDSSNGNPLTAEAAANNSSVPLYHIQIGAFGQPPAKSKYSKAGKVSIINENGLYKVLVGGFEQREDAERKRQELAANGFEGFIVRYQGDQRLK
jgi:cell division protein FtsN